MHKWRGRPGVSYYVIHGTGITCCHACMYSHAMEKTDLALCTFYEDERSTNSSTDWNRGQTVAFQGNFDPRYTFWSCNWFIGDAYLPYMLCLLSWLARWFTQQGTAHDLSWYLGSPIDALPPYTVVITVPLLIGIEKRTWLMSRFHDWRDWQQPPGLLSLTMLHPLMTFEPTNL